MTGGFYRPMDNQITPIINAARSGDVNLLSSLVTPKNINDRDEKGYTPLIIACYNHQPDAAAWLLQNGADVNAADFGGNTALMGACFKVYADIAQLLIIIGARLDLQHGNGGTALMFAAMFGRNELVKLLLDNGG